MAFCETSHLFLLPDVVVDCHLPSLPLLSPPLLTLLGDVVQLMVRHFKVIRHKEDLFITMETQVDVQQAAIVVESAVNESTIFKWLLLLQQLLNNYKVIWSIIWFYLCYSVVQGLLSNIKNDDNCETFCIIIFLILTF